jgi:hypothetical protein
MVRAERAAKSNPVPETLKDRKVPVTKFRTKKCAISAGKPVLHVPHPSGGNNKGASPIRVLIEATPPVAKVRQKSRWVRAQKYVSSEVASCAGTATLVAHHAASTLSYTSGTVARQRPRLRADEARRCRRRPTRVILAPCSAR